MICPKCTYEVIDGLFFCPQCGQALSPSQENPDPTSPDQDENTPFVSEPSEDTETQEGLITASSLKPASGVTEVVEPINASAPSDLPQAFVPPTATMLRPGSVSQTVAISKPTATQSDLKTTASVPPPTVVPGAATVSAAQPITKEAVVVERAIPKPLKPITTAGTFWYFFLISIPCVGLIVLICMASMSKNTSRKSLARAILLWRLVFLLAACLLFTVMFFVNRNFLVEIFDPGNWYSTIEFMVKTFLNY